MTAKLIKGENLTPAQIKQVKAAFINRLTTENGYPQRNPTGARVPAISDAQWLRETAFYFRQDGTLAAKPAHSVPAWLADQQ